MCPEFESIPFFTDCSGYIFALPFSSSTHVHVRDRSETRTGLKLSDGFQVDQTVLKLT